MGVEPLTTTLASSYVEPVTTYVEPVTTALSSSYVAPVTTLSSSYVPPVTRIGSVVRSASVDVLPVAKRARTLISEPTIVGSSYYGGLGSYGGSYYGGLRSYGGYGGYYGGARVIGTSLGGYGYGSGITRVL